LGGPPFLDIMAEDEKKAFYGGWFANRGSVLDSEEDFDVYQTKTKDYRNKEETKFYDDRLIEYEENEWYSFLVDYLVGELFTDFDFVGDGAEQVKQFFDEIDPLAYDEIEMMGLNVVREGTGALKKYWVDGELRQIKAMNGRLVRLVALDKKVRLSGNRSASKIGEKSGWSADNKYTQLGGSGTSIRESEDVKWIQMSVVSDEKFVENIPEWRISNFDDYRSDKVALCRIRRDPRTPYGLGFGKSCFHILKAMKMIDRDILAGIKQNQANLKLIRADLSGLDTDDDKKTALENLSKAYDKIATATTGVVAVDNHHEVGYMGNLGSGSRDSRLLEVMKHLEPVISSLLMNFLFSIGLIEQTGGNKSIISRQEIRAERQIYRYQRAVGRFFETQVFPDITDKKCKLVFRKYYDPEIWIKLFEKNIVSRERLLEEFAIIDDGTTYLEDLGPALSPVGRPGLSGGSPDSKTENNDDSSDQRSREEEQ
tara:strand:+ start:20 stop:1468 length:1449 start_codon:yes stop_codon:yes gene_type:complete